MKVTSEDPDEIPPVGGVSSLEVGAWHLQVLLSSLASFDGKIMFLTALNVAGVSALIGVEISTDSSWWLVGAGLAVSGAGVAFGLGSLWTAHLEQFPTPVDALPLALGSGEDVNALAWRHFHAVKDATHRAEDALRRRTWVMRGMLLTTPMALAIVVITAATAVT